MLKQPKTAFHSSCMALALLENIAPPAGADKARSGLAVPLASLVNFDFSRQHKNSTRSSKIMQTLPELRIE